MEYKHIDKIAGGLAQGERGGAAAPQSPPGSLNPRGVGAESPRQDTGPRYAAQRSIGREDQVSRGAGVSTPASENLFFEEKNRILEEDYGWIPVTTPEEYFKILFSRPGKDGADVNFMQATGQVYWGDHHYNAIAYNLIPVQVWDKNTKELVWKERAEKFDITRDLSECVRLKGPNIVKVISSPILYAGKSRTKDRARSIWGIAIDLDDVRPENLHTLIRFIEKFGYTPKPSMIVSSGGGLHLYYLFPKGVGTQISTVRALQRLKHNMTKNLWNGMFSSDPDPDLHQGIWQGFRIPGTPTKMSGYRVVGFVSEEIPYYTVRELNEWFQPAVSELIERDNKPLTEAEIKAVDNNKYLPSETSYQEAKIKWPEWEPNKTAGQWYCNRNLYDWWLNKVIRGGLAYKKDFKGTVPLASGRRFYWMQSLVAFAKKCGIPYEEVRADAYSLLEQFDSLTEREDNHFTSRDIEGALDFYKKNGKDSMARFTRNYIGAKTHYQFNKTKRNGRTREENLIIARTARDVNDRKFSRKWDEHNGRKEAKIQVQMWCMDHPYSCSKSDCAEALNISTHTVAKWWWHENPHTIPEAVLLWRQNHPGIENKSLCARECGITRPTVIKWWSCTIEDAKAEYERLNGIRQAGLAAINIRKSVVGYKLTDEQSAELHDIGAEFNTQYITDRKIADITMKNVEGYAAQTAETISRTGEELSDAINFEALNITELMRDMGIPEYIIPMMKAEFERQIQSPEFWEEYKKSRPGVDISDWPPEVKRAYATVISEHNRKK